MAVTRAPRHRKRDPAMRRALPDRILFACGACHALAHAVLERDGAAGHHGGAAL